MAKNFQKLRAKMSTGARAVSEAEHWRLIEENSQLGNEGRTFAIVSRTRQTAAA